jgi:CRP-like cAMP-binding protein/Fe-S-cluster-containing hydrogenase component 2
LNPEPVTPTLQDRLGVHPLLANLPATAIADLAQAVRVLEIQSGRVIIRQGEIHHSLYLVDEGKLRISIRDQGGVELNLASLGAGDIVGETAFITKGPRTATVRALTSCRLFEFPQREMYRFRRYPELWNQLEAISQERMSITMLCRVALFQALTPEERAEAASLLTLTRYAAGTAICQEGYPGDAFFIISRGQVKVTSTKGGRQQVLAYLHDDDFFGEGALLAERLRTATVTALTDVEALRLSREDFTQLVTAKPALEQAIRAVMALRSKPAVDIQQNGHWSTAMDLLVAQGLTLEAQVLVRQADLCPPGCHQCEEACAARFGRSRIRLGGRRFGSLDLMGVCQHCTHAACIEACFFDAIRQDENGLVHIVASACTGCTMCEHACTHGAVTMIEPEPEELRGWLKRLLSALTHRPPEMVAEICERCHGYDDMACLSACPTGALRLVTVGDYLRLEKQPITKESQTATER